MSSLRAPGLGPIVGHTTDSSCRLWIRADETSDDGATLASERRTIGVIGIVEGRRRCLKAFYFRLHREYDRTGTFTLGMDAGFLQPAPSPKLEPASLYTVRMGTLTVDDAFDDDQEITDAELASRLPDAKVWCDDLMELDPARAEAKFRTFPEAGQTADRLDFIIGSCRYPGMFWKAKRADRIFDPIHAQTADENDDDRPRFVLMVGDQIYADKLGVSIPIGLADTYKEFQERYRSAFGSRNMRKLLRQTPHYMILDDHEIEDNWTQDRIRDADKRRLFNLAIGAYASYQWIHGPRSFDKRLYYNFECGGYPFFVIDTRTQRWMDDLECNLDDNHLLGRPSIDPGSPGQLERLLAWMEQQQKELGNVPKFIVSSSVFVPNPMSARKTSSVKHKERSDSWPAFPRTRATILDRIVDNGIQNVVFLSGDIHCTNVARMRFTAAADADPELRRKADEMRAFSITSSAFYWPFPFADGDPSDYVHDSTAKGQEDDFPMSNQVVMDYEAWNFTQEDNFCRVAIDRNNNQLIVTVHDAKGRVIAFDRPGAIELAAW